MWARARPFALVATVGACNAVLGVEPLPRHQENHSFAYASPACGGCIVGQCAVEERACSDDAACAAAHACVASCAADDWSCRAACRDASSAIDDAVFAALDECGRAACLGECFANGGGFPFAAPACNDCLDAACADDLETCLADRRCEEQLWCELSGAQPNPEQIWRCRALREDPPAAYDARHCVGSVGSCASCPFNPDFRCVAGYGWTHGCPEAPYHVMLQPYGTPPDTLAGFQVTACPASACGSGPNGTCARPLAAATSESDGGVEIDLGCTGATGFDGCMHTAKEGWVPGLFYFGRPVVRAERFMNINVASASDLPLLATLVEQEIQPDKGIVLVIVQDCLVTGARAVVLDTLGGQAPVYVQNGVPLKGAERTDASGSAIYVNVAPGSWEVVARLGDTGSEVARYRIRVVAGSVTSLLLLPTPVTG
jgi:hypothetical protein